MIAFAKQYLFISGWFLSTTVFAFSAPEYSKGIKIGTVSTNSSTVQGIACSGSHTEHLYALSGHKVLVIDKVSAALVTTISVQETDNSSWSWDAIAVGRCRKADQKECIYLARQIKDGRIRIVRFQDNKNLQLAHKEKLAIRNDITIELPTTFPALAMFISINADADITLLTLEEVYTVYQINNEVWSKKEAVKLSAGERTEVMLQKSIFFKSLSWNTEERKVIAQVKDTANELYMFSGHNEMDSLADILKRKGHHVKLRLSEAQAIDSTCGDPSTNNLYAAISDDSFSIYRFEQENLGYSPYQSDQPQSQQQTRQLTCEDKNKHCPTWAKNEMCLKRKSYMVEYCPKSCQTCRQSERMADKPKCVDSNHLCAVWAEQGNCIAGSSQGYMQLSCKKSCKLCSKADSPMSMCRDEHQYCYSWAAAGRCKSRPDYMDKSCKASCGKCPVASKDKSLQKDQALNQPSLSSCKDMNEHCKSWAKEGKCDERKDYMFLHCPASCGLCGERMDEASNGACEDSSEYCLIWEAYGYCKAKAKYMKMKCPATCKLCRSAYRPKSTDSCMDHHESCDTYASHMMCTRKPAYMKENCPKSCGKCGDENSETISNRILEPEVKETTKATTTKSLPTSEECADKNNRCADWAEGGYCTLRPDYMNVYCKKACNLCSSRKVFSTTAGQQEKSTAAPTTERSRKVNPEEMKKESVGCVDESRRCKAWAKRGYCYTRPDYMKVYCKKSCNSCVVKVRQLQPTTTRTRYTTAEVSECKDSKEYCKMWAAADLCRTKPYTMHSLCPASCNTCQQEARNSIISPKTTPSPQSTTTVAMVTGCSDKSSMCSYRQAAGFCTTRELYMKQNCAKSCNLCEQKQQEIDCVDKSRFCTTWAEKKRCGQYETYMRKNCPKACNYCVDKAVTTTAKVSTEGECGDDSKYCKRWSDKGFCDIRRDYMSVKCKKSCNMCE